jgi:hypothetical protein
MAVATIARIFRTSFAAVSRPTAVRAAEVNFTRVEEATTFATAMEARTIIVCLVDERIPVELKEKFFLACVKATPTPVEIVAEILLVRLMRDRIPVAVRIAEATLTKECVDETMPVATEDLMIATCFARPGMPTPVDPDEIRGCFCKTTTPLADPGTIFLV